MNIRFDGKAAIVTGGSNGIGKGIALALAEAGAAVMICGRTPATLAEAKAEILAVVAGARVETYAGSAGSPEDAAACVARTLELFGRVDILVNNAPPGGHGRLMELEVETMDAAGRGGPRAVVTWTQAAWRAWMKEHGGAIVNVTSVGTEAVERHLGYYAAVKSGIASLTHYLAAELGPGVRVNAVMPGWILNRGAETGFAAHESKLAEMLPAKRLGTPADLGSVVVFLASDAASFVTGHIIPVDGGRLSAYSLFSIGTGRA